MAGELNTDVLDDPASCRTTAEWLGTVKSGVTHIGDVVQQQRGASESFWVGTAGEAARNTLTRHTSDADTLDGVIGQVKTALETFANEIDTVNSRMQQARQVAREGKLIVTPTAILPPGPAPKGSGTDNLPPGPMGQQIEAHQGGQGNQAAIAAHEAKKRAFQEASSTVQSARTTQQAAHQALEAAMKDPLAVAKTTKSYAMFVVGQGLNSVKGATDAASDMMAKAEKWHSAATTMQARAAQKSGTLRDIGNRAAAKGLANASEARSQATRASKFGGPLGEKARTAIAADASGWVKGTSRVANVGRGLVRGVPAVGTAFTIGSGVTDVMMGKDPWEATEDTAASLGGGAVGGYIGGTIGTMICPGVGTVIGGLVGGFLGSLAATEGVDAATGE